MPGWRPIYIGAAGQAERPQSHRRTRSGVVPGIPIRVQRPRLHHDRDCAGADRGSLAAGAGRGAASSNLAGSRGPAICPAIRTSDFAVTEEGNAFERRMADWAGLSFDGWRTGFYPGQVNDGNAHYGLAGISGHAGLFSDADEVGDPGGDVAPQGGLAGYPRPVGGSRRGCHHQPDAAAATPGGALAGTSSRVPVPPSRNCPGPTPDSSHRPSQRGRHDHPASCCRRLPSAIPDSPAPRSGSIRDTTSWPCCSPTPLIPGVDLNKPVNALRARFHNAVVRHWPSLTTLASLHEALSTAKVGGGGADPPRGSGSGLPGSPGPARGRSHRPARDRSRQPDTPPARFPRALLRA